MNFRGLEIEIGNVIIGNTVDSLGVPIEQPIAETAITGWEIECGTEFATALAEDDHLVETIEDKLGFGLGHKADGADLQRMAYVAVEAWEDDILALYFETV